MRVRTPLAPALTLALLAACAQVQVKAVATAPGEPRAFEVRSRTQPELQAEVARLCPKGHEVLRQSHTTARVEREGFIVHRTWQQAHDWLGTGNAHTAQALVQCKA